MRHPTRRVLAIAFLALLVLTGTELSVATAAPGDEPVVAERYRDYALAPEIRSAGQDQCASTMASRRGPWLCVGTPAQAGAREGANPSSGTVTAAAAGYCRVEGCWDVIDTTHAEFSGQAYYGYGATQLGKVTLFFRISMSGARTTSYPVRFTSSRGVRNLDFEGERIYISPTYPGGRAIAGTWAHAGPYTATAGQQRAWPSPGYKSYENTTSRAAVVHTWSWQDQSSAYPGTWYVYVKSNILTRQSSGAYYFTSDTALPSTPSYAGYTQ